MGQLEEGVWGVDCAYDIFFVTNGQKRDYLSHDTHTLLRVGETKKPIWRTAAILKNVKCNISANVTYYGKFC